MFSKSKKKKQAEEGQARNARKGGASGLSIIAPDVVVSGDVTTAAQIHIDGRIEGDVRCDTLVQGAAGTIVGNILGDSVHLSGLVDGTVKARLVTLDSSARVTGDVAYETLSIAAGATIDGRLSRKAGAPAPAPDMAAPARPAAEKKRGRTDSQDQPILMPSIAPVGAATAAG